MTHGIARDDAALLEDRLAGAQAALAVLVVNQRQYAVVLPDGLVAPSGEMMIDDGLNQVRKQRAAHRAGGARIEIRHQGDRLLAVEGPGDRVPEPPRLIGLGRWRISGDMSREEFERLFGIELPEASGATMGACVAAGLGRVPQVGDVLEVGRFRVEVEATDQTRAAWLHVVTEPEASS